MCRSQYTPGLALRRSKRGKGDAIGRRIVRAGSQEVVESEMAVSGVKIVLLLLPGTRRSGQTQARQPMLGGLKQAWGAGRHPKAHAKSTTSGVFSALCH
jgi:hypothetical protein